MMAFLRKRIKHVIYVVKENRTYDQIHGDLPRGNGDPSLAILSPYSPNHQKLATPVRAARQLLRLGRDLEHRLELDHRRARHRLHREDLAGELRRARASPTTGRAATATSTSSPAHGGRATGRQPGHPARPRPAAPAPPTWPRPTARRARRATGYLWDAALRAGPDHPQLRLLREQRRQLDHHGRPRCWPAPSPPGSSRPSPPSRRWPPHTDEYFRGYDQNNADFYLFKEWEREFDGYVAGGQAAQPVVRAPARTTTSATSAPRSSA